MKIKNHNEELSSMREECQSALTELDDTNSTLQDVRKKMMNLSGKLESNRVKAQKQLAKYEESCADFIHFEELLLEKNSDLSEMVKHLQKQLNCKEANPCDLLQTMEGRQYSSEIRSLYYQLLADQVPLTKITTTIKAILGTFVPSVDVKQLRLPSEGCAGYMRRQELKTVSMVHKATTIAEQASVGCHLNSDGTTKFQKKIQGVAMNGMTLSVNEVPNGCTESIIEDISAELKKLREIAHSLKIPNADKINWTLIVSSTSDSAATQKRFNRLLEERKEEDEKLFGPADYDDVIDVIENFCAMHLGVNLRKAFLSGVKKAFPSDVSTNRREYNRTDTFVHEFCKLFGRHGVPEYGCGASAFSDYLQIMRNEDCYYQNCIKISLDRQVGSRYFVTTSNAGKAFFLRDAALTFLQYTGKESGNALEQEVFRKLNNPIELSQLKADAIMFCHVYADIVMLAKSNDLNKSAFDMHQHYYELQLYLEKIVENPQIAMNQSFEVFPSEKRLYGSEKTNHRTHLKYLPVMQRLFTEDEWDSSLLFPLFSAGAAEMKLKLCAYASNQLPGGIYWEPEPEIKSVLKKLKPNNDLCESMLGLNDHLATVIPNMLQLTRSNLIEVKKNRTMEWYRQIPKEAKHSVTDLAIKRRVQVMKEFQEENVRRDKIRQDKLVQENRRLQAIKKKNAEEAEKLSKIHLITSSEELRSTLSEIDLMSITLPKKRERKRNVLREQIRVRKKLLKQQIKITLTENGRQRCLSDIENELSTFLDSENSSICNPECLVNKHILHRFEYEGKLTWYSGYVLSYNHVTDLHELSYDSEEDHCHFNLMEDLINGDLKIVNK